MLAARLVDCANSRWGARVGVKNMKHAEKDIGGTPTAARSKINNAAQRKVFIVLKKLKGAFKPVSTLIEMESQVALTRIRSELNLNDSNAVRLLAKCCAVLANRIKVVCYGLSASSDSAEATNAKSAAKACGVSLALVQECGDGSSVTAAVPVFDGDTDTGGAGKRLGCGLVVNL